MHQQSRGKGVHHFHVLCPLAHAADHRIFHQHHFTVLRCLQAGRKRCAVLQQGDSPMQAAPVLQLPTNARAVLLRLHPAGRGLGQCQAVMRICARYTKRFLRAYRIVRLPLFVTDAHKVARVVRNFHKEACVFQLHGFSPFFFRL